MDLLQKNNQAGPFFNNMDDFVRTSYKGFNMVSDLINYRLQTNDVCVYLTLYLFRGVVVLPEVIQPIKL